MRTDHTADDESRIDSETDSAVDVALDVALELADDPEVTRYIRRALQSRVRVRDEAKHDDDRDVVGECPEDLLDDVTAEENPFNDNSHLYGDENDDLGKWEPEPTSLDVHDLGGDSA